MSGACIKSGRDRFRVSKDAMLEFAGGVGVVGGVSNPSSEDELQSISAGSPPFRAGAASGSISGESSNTSAFAKSSASSWSG